MRWRSINRSADFDSPGFVNGAYGYLPNDRRHSFRAYGSYRLFDVLDLGLNALVQSPAHYSCIGAVPVDVDAYANTYHGYGFYCQGKLITRGTAFKGDWRTEFNFSAAARLTTSTRSSLPGWARTASMMSWRMP